MTVVVPSSYKGFDPGSPVIKGCYHSPKSIQGASVGHPSPSLPFCFTVSLNSVSIDSCSSTVTLWDRGVREHYREQRP